MAKKQDKQQQEQKAGQEQGQATALEQQDLALLDDRLEDETKDDAALWAEMDADESGKPAPDDADSKSSSAKASADQESGDSEDWGADETGDRDSASDDDSAAQSAGDDDKGASADDKESESQQASDSDQTQGDDLFANATPEQRAAYEEAQAKLKALKHAERSNRGRISALQRQIQDFNRSSQGSQQDAGQASRGQQQGDDDRAEGSEPGADNFLSSDDWQSFKQEYPEVAGPMEKVLQQQQQTVTRLQKELSAIGDDRRQDALTEQTTLLAEEHPDWDQVVAEDSFPEWLEQQPRHIQEAALRNSEEIVDAAEAADVVGRFKQHRENGAGGQATPSQETPPAGRAGGSPNQQARRQRQLESASTARARGPGAASGVSEDADEETIWKQFDDKERREAAGRA